MKTIVFLWSALMALPSFAACMEAARIHVDCMEHWKETKEKVQDAFGNHGRVLLEYNKDEIDINPNGYENELDFVVAGTATQKTSDKTELRKLKLRPTYAVYHRVYIKRENIKDSIMRIKGICRDSKVKVEGVVLMVFINDAVKTHVLCDVLRYYKKELYPIDVIGILISSNHM
jgi:hypothetical protein